MRVALVFGLGLGLGHAIDINVNDRQSLQQGAAIIAHGLMDFYNGNDTGETPGMFTHPYYWWEAGVAWNTMLNYAYYSGDNSYNNLIKSSLLFQSGDANDYMVENQTTVQGNDDQAMWGLAAMSAAEKGFIPPGEGYPDNWVNFAENVYRTMNARWDSQCGGGLRWQIYDWNRGYDYKNVISNAGLFNLATRLYRYSGNPEKLETAERVWDWLEASQAIQTRTTGRERVRGQTSFVYDGIDANTCHVVKEEWTYNQGLLISGCAAAYNQTGDPKWLNRIYNLWNRAQVFFAKGDTSRHDWNATVMFEAACQRETYVSCNTDQRNFKGIFAGHLGLLTYFVPEFQAIVGPWLENTAHAMAQSCSGGLDGHTCGLNWFHDGWDGFFGLGEQISALAVANTQLQKTTPRPAALRAEDIIGHESPFDMPEGHGPARSPQGPNSGQLTPPDVRASLASAKPVSLIIVLVGAVAMLF